MELVTLYEIFKNSSGIGTDTRKDLTNKIFFALRGDNFNGNEYASQALKLGASYAVVDQEMENPDKRFLYVDDVLVALQELARYHRRQLGTEILGITGSNGKTTNKELLHLVLAQKLNCYATKGNLNNHIGVPLSLLELKKEHEIGIIEMGANKMGDIRELCEIAEPNLAYITNIGLAHLEGFGSRENIEKEKGELFRFVMKKGGSIFVNSSEKEVVRIAGDYSEQVLVGERQDDQYHCQCFMVSPNVSLKVVDTEINSQLYGQHNYENLKMAASIGLWKGIDSLSVTEALESYRPSNNRSQIEQVKGVTVLMDAYNANPTSMKASIKSFSELDFDTKHLILGDMLELGDEAEKLHEELLEFTQSHVWKTIFVIGPYFTKAAKKYTNVIAFEDTRTADATIAELVKVGDAVLLKGSRGIKLETLSVTQQ